MKNSEISVSRLMEEMEAEHETSEGVLAEKGVYDKSLEEDKEELTKEFIAENRKRLRAVVEIDKLFDQLDTAKRFGDRKNIVDKIDDFLDKNENIIAREDKSGAEEFRYYRRRLDKFRAETERAAA